MTRLILAKTSIKTANSRIHLQLTLTDQSGSDGKAMSNDRCNACMWTGPVFSVGRNVAISRKLNELVRNWALKSSLLTLHKAKAELNVSFDTFQDRLIPELRLKRIKRMDTANRYLKETFIPNYWEKQIRVNPQCSVSEFTPVPKGTDLDAIFVVKDYQKIRMDHTLSYGNKFYLIESPLRHSIAKQKIEIRTGHDDDFTAFFADRELVVSEVIEPTKPSMFDLDIQKKLEVLELAEHLDNVPEASRISGVSRDTIYRHRRLIKEGGVQALRRQVSEDHTHANRTDQSIAEAIIEFSLHNPHLGQVQVSNHLRTSANIDISATGVRTIWLRENMQTIALRM